jgi:hypothetical protein
MIEDDNNYLELTLSDGTVARWVIPSDALADIVSARIEEIIGAPDTIIC